VVHVFWQIACDSLHTQNNNQQTKEGGGKEKKQKVNNAICIAARRIAAIDLFCQG
jgi:hypothetical protein